MFDEILKQLSIVRCSAKDAESLSPDTPGYYAIFLKNPAALPKPFSTSSQPGNPIYIGIATKSLHKRLACQDLKYQSPATFFRRLGAVLGYRPEPGSLRDKKNKNNYKFSPANTQQIRNWIDQHLLIGRYLSRDSNRKKPGAGTACASVSFWVRSSGVDSQKSHRILNSTLNPLIALGVDGLH